MADIHLEPEGIKPLEHDGADTELLQLLQDAFCRAHHVYLICLDGEEGALTSAYGSGREQEYIRGLVDEVEYLCLVHRMRMELPERMEEAPLDEDYAKLCGISTKADGQVKLVWIVAAILSDRAGETEVPDFVMTTTEEQFYRSMEFLESLSKVILTAWSRQAELRTALKKCEADQAGADKQLSQFRTLTGVARCLESGDDLLDMAYCVLREVCVGLDIDGGYLIRANADGQTADMICEYVSNERYAVRPQFQNRLISDFPFFDGKPYLVSSDSGMPERFLSYFEICHISAMLCLPLELEGQPSICLCLFENGKERQWQKEDVDFVNDVKRIAQSFFSWRIAENSLAGSHAALEEILENAGCGIYVADYASRTILYMNQRFKELFSRSIAADRLDELVFADNEVRRSYYCEEIYSVEEDRWLDVRKTEIPWEDDRPVSLCTLYDITDKKLYQKEVESRVNNDFLTGLYNRMRCEQDLEKYVKKAKAEGKEGALCYIDLDDFKHINDGLGHQYGDVLLKAISHSLKHISGLENSCYRMGGDEFVLILQDIVYPERERIIQEVMAIFSKPWFLKGEDYYCTMSMGVACFPTDGDTVDDLIRKADMALFAAKREGKNRVEYYNDKDDLSASRRLDMEKNMRAAALNACSEFEVYYQPIIDAMAPGMPCCGAEALVRWNSSEMGFVGPDAFIPLAEYLGLINPIGEHVLKKAANRCRSWNDMGHPNYKVNVNLSVVQLLQNDVVKKVKKVLKDTGLNPNNLTLEVTESLAIDDMDRMKRILGEIRSLGVKVALDDFGTGYSSLNHIREMPLDVIKIDRCFIEHLGEDDFSDAFVKMVAELAATIGVKVCVEGVETDRQLQVLSHMNIAMIQGYYFGRPLPLKEFEERYL